MQRLPVAALLAMAVLCFEHPGWAARVKKSVRGDQAGFASDCAEYSQEKVDDGLRFELRNTCSYALTCSLSWQVRCEGGRNSPGARSTQLELPANGTGSASAYASACAPHGWSISDVRWRCDKREASSNSAQ
jgi:hypothetical protein